MNPSRILLPLVAALAFYSCEKTAEEPQAHSPEVKVTGVSLNKTELTLTEGRSETLQAAVKPDNATNKTVTWSTSNASIATVDGGKVTALKEGTATVSAKAGDLQADCKVTVKKNVINVTEVSLNKTEISLFAGATETLVATVKPDDATDKTVTWSSSDEEVAMVAGGLVTALTAGTATITASAQNKIATCQVTVSAATMTLTLSSSDSPILKAAGGSGKAVLTASESWTLSSDEDWLTVSPLSGNAGVIKLTLTTSANSTGKSRSANISVSNQEGNRSFTIIQRPDVLTRTKASSGRVTNSVSVTYSGTKFTRIYTILPVPLSNNYQDISNLEAPGCRVTQCLDGINSYIWKDLQEGSIPASGDPVISESFDATVYRVTADIAKIDDIPPYDPDSEECRKYLGKESGDLVDPTNTKIADTAESLWNESGGHILEYARKCHQWTHGNMRYGNMGTGLHPISELMQTMTGDCGNYASVFISLLRAKGIPARHVVMVEGQKDEVHVRAEFYVPAYGWIPADPNWGNNYFGVFAGNYIVVSKGVNQVVRGEDEKNFTAPLLQDYCIWYWYQSAGTGIRFSHSCIGLK